ncbi:MAG TPA: hypothetical protein VGS19_05000 [Streptosporangiaceae bacterium]|nr:hypothetical protein [Streptosporangiaceae bacterium]
MSPLRFVSPERRWRAGSMAPSSHHLDEVHRICWTLEDLLAKHRGDSG